MNCFMDFKNYQKEIADLQYTCNLLMWELKIIASKDSQLSLVELISKYNNKLFLLQTSDEYGNLLQKAILDEEFLKLTVEEKRYIKNLLKQYNEFKLIPFSFYSELSKLKNESNIVWQVAKKENNYEKFKPYLEKLITMSKEYYKYLGSNESNIYDFMLNEFEGGLNKQQVDNLFNELKCEILYLMPTETDESKRISVEYTHDELISCAKFLLNYIGFDLNKGSLGIYPHGFTQKINDSDIRIAFNETNDPISFVSTIIHEGGHGIFEQNISSKLSVYENTTIGNLTALHESQSRFFENMLGRNKNFWIPIYDEIKKMLKLNIDIDEFVRLLNSPKAGLIRVNADELTYCMHIIIRYEIERDLFEGVISVDDLPRIWNEKMHEYLHVDVVNDSDGLMQDVHWSEAEFGYFPCYLIGSIYAGMFLEQVEKDLGSVDELLQSGRIKEITKYLIKNIYVNGGAYSSFEIIDKMIGGPVTSKPFIRYLQKKYDKVTK
ncbi:MAG: carboxypeptidase M32 [Bacilli bacterium]